MVQVLGLADLRRRESDGCANVSAREKAKERAMSDSVYKVIEIIGTSKESWKMRPRSRSSARARLCATCGSPKL